MRRLPLRLRLALVFALAMAVVLAGTGTFIYYRVADTLRDTVDSSLRTRSSDVTALVRRGAPLSTASSPSGFAQVVAEDGRVVDATRGVEGVSLLSPSELAGARRGRVFLESGAVPGDDDPTRLLASPVDAGGERLVVVVGASVEARDETLAGLRTQMLVGGPVALLLASVAGYILAGAALRPVESMRRRAAEISASTLDRRLPLPAARDEVHRLGVTLNDMLARLQESVERERRFVADASHELRTPLALLRTELELALRRSRSAEELRQAVASAAGEADRLSQLAEDLLVLARSDEGGLPVRLEDVAAGDLLAGAVQRVAGRAENGRSISIEGGDEVTFRGDRLRLGQALGNLVDNALRHGSGAVRLSAVAGDGRVELHVADEGAGFDPEFLERAFERFSRGDESRTGRGAGLGLAIAAVIAQAHGGDAHAANSPGGGADVWLSLPR